MNDTIVNEFNLSQQEIILSIISVTSVFSLVGSLFIILTYLIFRETRTFGTSLIFFLSISDFMTSISWFPWSTKEILCIIQAASLQFFEVASCLWSFTISYCIFQVIGLFFY